MVAALSSAFLFLSAPCIPQQKGRHAAALPYAGSNPDDHFLVSAASARANASLDLAAVRVEQGRDHRGRADAEARGRRGLPTAFALGRFLIGGLRRFGGFALLLALARGAQHFIFLPIVVVRRGRWHLVGHRLSLSFCQASACSTGT